MTSPDLAATRAAMVASGDDDIPHEHRERGFRALLATILEDLDAAHAHDPAARNRLEVALAYPGVHALWAHRLTHRMWDAGLKIPARLLSQFTRFLTGIEIHPGAVIGRRLFIDHGMGVVIGQTAVVGDDCLLFHGSTLGGRSMTRGKRHPTLGNRVMVGAGAQVLGDLLIGDDAQIGANAVVTHDVPAGYVAVGVPAKNHLPGQPLALRPQGCDASVLVDYEI